MQTDFDLSVVLPNYNHAQYLPESLGAIFSQSVLPREVLVLDDASTDDSLQVLRELQKKYDRLKVIENKQNKGVHEVVNQGVQLAKGKYLALCSADDVILPEFFATGQQMFEKHPESGLCCGDFATFCTGENHQFYQLLPVDQPLYLQPTDLVRLMRQKSFYIGSNVSLYRRDLVLKYGIYKKGLKSIADIYLCYQIGFRAPVVYVPKPFGSCRLVEQSYGALIRKNFRARYQLWDAFFAELAKEDSEFRTQIVRSHMLGTGGYFVLLYLFLHPKLWILLPSVLLNVVKRKIKGC